MSTTTDPSSSSARSDGSFDVVLNDEAMNAQANFPSNFITTSRYNLLTFLPLNLWQQFHRFANCYFLACIFIQIIPNVSPFPIYTNIIPLVVILTVSAVKDGIEDYHRHRLDYLANNREFALVRNFRAKSFHHRSVSMRKSHSQKTVTNGDVELQQINEITPSSGLATSSTSSASAALSSAKALDGGVDESEGWTVSVTSKDIRVGQILQIKEGEEFPADLVLLSSSNSDSTAFVNTANLDGEAVPKVRIAPQPTLHADTPQKLLVLQGRVKAEAANANLYQFQARIELDTQASTLFLSPRPSAPVERGPSKSHIHINEQGDSILVETPHSKSSRAANVDRTGRTLFPIGDQQLCLRGSRLVNTKWMYGLVVYTGYQTKMMLNRNAPRVKVSYFEHKLNQLTISVFVFNFLVCLLLSISFAARDQSWATVYHVAYPGGVGWLLNFLTQYILLSFMIPISLYVTIELVRVGQVFFMQWDRRMHYRDPVTREWRKAQVKSSSLNEELGCIEYVFSDKTGTLTQNKMELSAMSVNGNLYFERSAAEIALEEDALYGDADGEVDELKREEAEQQKRAREQLERKEAEENPSSQTAMVADLVAKAMKKRNQKSGDDRKEADINDVIPGKKSLKPRPKNTQEVPSANGANGSKKSQDDMVTQEMMMGLSAETIHEKRAADADAGVDVPESGSREKSRWQFQSQSPDEIALCETCHRHGLTMTSRRGDTVKIHYSLPTSSPSHSSETAKTDEEFIYTIVSTLDFTSTRARMSVVVRTSDNQYRLYLKGADTAVFKRLAKEEETKDDAGEPTSLQAKTLKHVETFAAAGSRTLCYAYRSLSIEEFNSWEKTFQQAINALEDREALVELAFEEIEHSMILLGCTGVEDQLQEHVPEAVDFMIKAGVKVIVLTGDKKETAVTIARQSNLVPDSFDLFYMQGTTEQAAYDSLDATLKDMKRVKDAEHSDKNEKLFALAIDGLCMELCLKYYRSEFINLFTSCATIVAYRSTPRQKALCVAMAKQDLKASVLAIGDGANDVSMIQEAKVGVGILGKEGAHAAMAADYVIHRFYHLVYLIFVQGRYNFYRTTKVCFFSFYKNMLYSFPQIYYSFYSLNTGETLYVAVYQSAFNLLFVSLPPLFVGWYEKDLPDDLVLNYPETFQYFKQESIFTMKEFASWMLSAIWGGTVLYFFMYFAIIGNSDASGEISQDGRPVYLYLFGTIILLAVILLSNLKFVTALDYITDISVYGALAGVVLFISAMALFGAEYFISFSPEGYQIVYDVFSTNLTWSYTALVLGVVYIPTLLWYTYSSLYRPTTAQKFKVWWKEASKTQKEQAINGTIFSHLGKYQKQ